MPTLRDIIDNRTIIAAAPAASRPSPVAEHVSKHIQDPFGATKQDFQKLQKAKLSYDMERENTQRNLAPVQSVIDHAAMLHGLTVGSGMSNAMPGTPGMDGGQPGMPGDPNQMNGDNPEMDEDGNPINMGQTVGKMNQSRPSQAGFQPGVAPGPQESVRPPKLGQAQPGKPAAQNSPQPRGSNPQNMQYNKQAQPPKGNKSMPGAKGPGDKKVQNKTNKAQGNSSRQIKVNVSASEERMSEQFGLGILKAGGISHSGHSRLDAVQMNPATGSHPGGTTGRPSSGMHQGTPSARPLEAKKSKLKAGPASLEDKDTDTTGTQESYNPVIRSSKCQCAKCKAKRMEAHGSREGAMRGWGTRGRGNPKGHASEKELKSKSKRIRKMTTMGLNKLPGVGHHRPGMMKHGKGMGFRKPNPAF